MDASARPSATKVISPFGPLTIADLPSPGTQRWSIRRKATVIAAVRGGLLSLEDACSRYALNIEEYFSWEYCIDRFGPAGLRTTRTQLYLTHGERQRNLRRSRQNWQPKERTCVIGTAPPAVCETTSNTEGGKLFAVVGIGGGFTECGSIDFSKRPLDGPSTYTFSTNVEYRSSFNVAWFGRAQLFV
jgi:hypothetical protein